jgi:hypothetical protein
MDDGMASIGKKIRMRWGRRKVNGKIESHDIVAGI